MSCLFFSQLLSFFLFIIHILISVDNLAIATKDTDIITNAVILLFVNEIDGRLYQLAETCNLQFISEVIESSQSNSFYDKKELLIHRAFRKTTKRLRRILFITKYNNKYQQQRSDDEEIVISERVNIENIEDSCLSHPHHEEKEI